MEIVIIGTGNTATVLGNKIKIAGHRIVQVFGRNAQKSSDLANALGSESANNADSIYKKADLYLVAVSDRGIADVLKDLQLSGRPIAHTAGAVPLNVLKLFTSKFGVLYPLQSLKKGVTESPDIPILIDAGDALTLELLKELAQTLSPLIMVADDEQRLKLHMAAVFCNNFVNHIYFLMEQYCTKEGLDFRLLIPLIQETGKRLDHSTPAQAQTGPAIRQDNATLERHLTLLETYPHLKELYRLLTQSIQQLH